MATSPEKINFIPEFLHGSHDCLARRAVEQITKVPNSRRSYRVLKTTVQERFGNLSVEILPISDNEQRGIAKFFLPSELETKPQHA